jgi:hypothetical protein
MQIKTHKRSIYIRRIRSTDKAEDIRTAIRMSFFEDIGRRAFGVFMHGRSNRAMMVFQTKRECKACMMGGWKKAKKFFKRRRK